VFGAYRTLVGNRVLMRLLVGEFISGIGDWLYLVALLVVVYRESSDPLVLGIVGGARIIPYIVLSVPAGIIVDRYDRRLVLLITDLIRGATMVALAAVTFAHGPVIVIVGLAIFATCFATFFRPALGAYIPSLVRGEDELGPANSAFATLGEVSFIIGPAIGGLIIAASDLGLAFVINAITFVVVAAILWTLPPAKPRDKKATDEAEGTEEAAPAADAPPDEGTFRRILRPIAGLALLDLVSGFMYGGLSVVLVILAIDRLHGGEEATGYLWAAIGVGGVVGALASSSIALRPNLGPSLVLGAIVLGGGMILLGLTDALPIALIACVITAAGTLIAEVVSTTTFQRIVPDAVRGRTLGAMQTIATVTYAGGSFLMPLLVANIGAQIVFPIGGVAIIVASFVTLGLVGAAFRRTVDTATATLLRVSKLPVFTGVSPAALEVAAGKLVPVDVTVGTVVIREGDPSDRFYIIESGRFAVDQRDPGTGLARHLRDLGPDDVFGELGLMHGAPRSATVTATSVGKLLELDGPDFLELLSADSDVSSRLLDRYRATAAPPS